MPLRSVLEIDVDDSRFKDFLALFEKYKEAVKAMPADWADMGSHVDPLAAQFAAMTAALLAQAESIHRMNREEEEQEKKTSRIGRAWGTVSKHSREVLSHVAETTRHLLHWTEITGLFSGVLGLGGMWGLDRMVNSAGALRSQALGTGASPAALLAARVNWGQFFNTQGALSSIAGLQQSLGGQVPFNVLGIPGAWNSDPLTAMNEAALAVHRLYQQTPAGMRANMPWYQQAKSIFGSDEAIRSIGNMSDRELMQHYGRTRQDVAGGFGLKPGTLEAAQNVSIQLERVGYTLEYTFLAALKPIMPQLDHLSAALGDVVTKFLGSDGFKHGVDVVANALEHFANWVGSKDFSDTVESIVTEFDHLLAALGKAVHWIEKVVGTSSGSVNTQYPAQFNADLFRDQWHWLGQRTPGSPGTYFSTHTQTGTAAKGAGMPVIGAALASSGLPREAQAYLYAVAAGETGAYAHPFDTLAGGSSFDSSKGYPVWPGFTHDGVVSHGAGAWQDEGPTQKWMAAHGYGFDVQGQIKGNWAWASQIYSDATGGRDFLADLRSGTLDPRGMSKLGGQWARGGSAVGDADYQKYMKDKGFWEREGDSYGEVLRRRNLAAAAGAAGGAAYANVKVGVQLDNQTGQSVGISVGQLGAGPQ